MSTTTKIAVFAAVALVLPIVLVGAAASGIVAAVFGTSDTSTPSQDALDDIPQDYLALYQQAATACPGLDWTILAAIGKIESNHGRSNLPGVAPGTQNSAGARGPMQFLKPTFDGVIARHTIPAGGTNPPSPWNKHDAIYAASFYLCDNMPSRTCPPREPQVGDDNSPTSAGKSDYLCDSGAQKDIRKALFAYNHDEEYVNGVLAQAKRYGTATVGTGDCNKIQAPNPAAIMAINFACGQLGLPYVWGGKCAELRLMKDWAGSAHVDNRQVGATPVTGSPIHFALSAWESRFRLDKTQRCCVRCNAMERPVDLPGAAHLVLASGVVHLDPESAVFEAMLEGWATQQRARFLSVGSTVKPRSDLVRRFAEYTNLYPWQWEPAEVEAFIVSRSIAPSTARNYQNCLRMFCEFVTDARYGWPAKCLELFGSAPRQILHEANTISHVADYEGDPARRPLTYDEVQALFDAADGRVEEIQARHRKGALTAMRDSAMLKAVYAFGLRRQETVGLDVADWRRNPKVPAYGGFGGVFVRWGKSSHGSPPKRRTVFTVAEFDWIVPVLQHYRIEVRPLLAAAQHPAMWVTERGGRMSRRRLNRTFGLVRDLAGLPPELDLHALRHSFVTHLVEFDYPQKFIQDQCGHSWGSTTAIYTGVSDEYRNRLVQRALTDRHADLWEDQT